MHEIIPLLIGGIALFLYSITQLSTVLRGYFSENAKQIIQKYTKNIFLAIIIGTILTILLGSSSAVIILVIIFINARSLTFKNALGLIMGANIGTTVSSQIIALDVGKYFMVPLLLGLVLSVAVKNEQWKTTGKALLYFGMLFFGLFLMEGSVMPLRDSQMFSEMIERVEGNSWQGALIGGFITLVIQSSSGTVGIAIVLGKQQLLSAAGGIAVMLGAELGTCSDTLIATINGNRQAFKAGLFHLLFNLTTIIIGLLLFGPFVNLVDYITQSDDIGKGIANAHMIFNILGVVIVLPFVPLIAKGLNKIIKEKEID